MSKQFDAYMAGVIDSDGSISICKKHITRPNPNYSVVIQLGWAATKKSLSAIKEIQKRYGGYLSFHKRSSTFSKCVLVYKYQIDGQKALPMLRAIKPFLLLKKAQCDLAIKMLSTIKLGQYGGGRPKPEWLKTKQNKYAKAIRSLNTKNSGDRSGSKKALK